MEMQSSSAACMRIVAITALVASLSGCVITPEGPLFTISDIPEPLVNKKISRYEGIPSDFRNPFPDIISVTSDARKGVIVIGRLSAYRKFDEKNIERGYNNYVESFQKARSDATPSLGFAEFRNTVSGWTMIQVYGAPFVVAVYLRALVSSKVVSELRFENFIHSFVAYDTTDLVAAESNADGALVIKVLLCREGPKYSDCALQYEKGVFDLETGLELTMGLKPKVNTGDLIDPISYKLLRDRN